MNVQECIAATWLNGCYILNMLKSFLFYSVKLEVYA